MRNFQRFKVIQLLVSVIAAFGSMAYLFFSGVISQGLLAQPAILILSLLVWGLSLLSFIYILVDAWLLRKMTSEYVGLETMTYRDELTGLPNRTSCDLFLEQALEDGTFDHIGFVLLRLDNLQDTNETDGYEAGDALLLHFAKILTQIGQTYGTVVRNSPSTFGLIFPDATKEELLIFHSDLKHRILNFNESNEDEIILYSSCIVDNREHRFYTVSDLIRHAYQHLEETV